MKWVNPQTLSQLVQKHPDSKKATNDIVLLGPLPNIHLVKFQRID